jgi:adhesin/invasin
MVGLSSTPLRRRVLRARLFSTIALALAGLACGGDGNGPVTAKSVALTGSGSYSINVGQSVTIYVHASDDNGTRIPKFSDVTWSSSNTAIATVTKNDTSATITGLSVGETVITATIRSGLSAQATIRVGSVPVISLSAPTAVFSAYRNIPVGAKSITITNGGAGVLSALTASSSAIWLQASFVGAVTTANPTATLLLQPTVTGLNDGSYSATVTVASAAPGVAPKQVGVTLQLSASPVAFKIEALSPPTQSGSAGQPVAQPPSVQVRAADDTPVPGVAVTFASSGGGTIAPSGVVTTNANGIASLTSWTLGTQPGALQTVTASSPGLAGSPVTFTATSLAASKLVKVSGDAQKTVVGRALAQPLVVLVSDPNNTPVPNATVTFTPSSGGSVEPLVATTNASGQASVTWTLGGTIGTQTLVASLVGPQGSAAVTFTATGTGATGLVKVAGDGQSSPAGSTLPTPIRVRAVGEGDLPAGGVTVTFVAGNGGNVNPATAVTDANGEATTRWTLPRSVGGQSLTASVTTESGVQTVSFSANATTPPPSNIQIIDGDGQSGQGGAALPRQIVARVVNTIGGAVSGVTVTFTPVSGAGQSFSPSSGVSNANGEVRTTWTLGGTLGQYTASVTAPGLGARTITASATQLPSNQGTFTGSAAKVPNAAVPTAGEQAFFVYSGPASGEVALSGGSFVSPVLPAGTYTVSVVSKSGAFPTTTLYGVSLPGGQVTSLGTIALAYSGVGGFQFSIHACSQVGDGNGSAVVKLYSGVNGDQSGNAPAYAWTVPFGAFSNQTGVNYGIYTMVVTTQANDPTKTCLVYRASVQHSFTASGGSTQWPLTVLSNP